LVQKIAQEYWRLGVAALHPIISDGEQLESRSEAAVERTFFRRLLGLTSMRKRVRLLNGTISIDSKPMGGTRIHVRVPFEAEHAQKAAG
jgi:signal transduction histidine kinase